MVDERSNRRTNGASNAAGSNNPRLRARGGASAPASGQSVRSASPRANAPQPVRPAGAHPAASRANAPQQTRANGAQPVRPAGARPAARNVRPAQQNARVHSAYQQVPGGGSRGVQPTRTPGKPSPEGKKKGGLFWRVVFWVALLVFVVSAGALAYIGYTYWQGQKTYDDLASDAFTVPDSNTLADFEVDWDALRAINSDVVGWIYMPGTDINYPIAWREGDDDYYLTHNFNGVQSAEFGAEYGSIMLSGVNASDYSDTVNIIYGHNMANGSMFGRLSKMWRDADDWNSHRLVYLLTPQGNYLLQTYSVVHVPGSSTDIIIPNFGSEADRAKYMQDKIDRSIVEADPAASPAEEMEKTFALVTCDGSDRSYRYITYCEVLEFYPVGSSDSTGSDAVDGASGDGTSEGSASGSSLNDGSMVSNSDLSAVGDAASDRTS